MKKYFTSESVTEGHPDKICDKISDKILDEALLQDPDSHMAIEATIKNRTVFLYGEAMTKANLDYEKIVHWVLKDIGYGENFEVIQRISKQSFEIGSAVKKENTCAGDQGIMFGFACSDTKEYMPLPIMLANQLAKKLTEIRKSNPNSFLLPDGKTQVTVEYEDNFPTRVDTVIIAAHHKPDISQEELTEYIISNVILEVIETKFIDSNTKFLINTGGPFTIGGPDADSGTTGRKIVADTYGGMGRVGGGCFSSKDPSKVDRSAAYYARYVAKNIVLHHLADKVEIGLAYAIGQEFPLHVSIETFGTENVSLAEIQQYIQDHFCFSVSHIIEELDLKKPIYYSLSAYGHFGRAEFSWEQEKSN